MIILGRYPTDRLAVASMIDLLTNFTNTAFPAVSVSQLSRVSSMAAEVEAAARPRRAASVVLMMGGRQVVEISGSGWWSAVSGR